MFIAWDAHLGPKGHEIEFDKRLDLTWSLIQFNPILFLKNRNILRCLGILDKAQLELDPCIHALLKKDNAVFECYKHCRLISSLPLPRNVDVGVIVNHSVCVCI